MAIGAGVENAKITSTHLGFEGHNLLTANLTLQGPSWGQGFGGYAMASYKCEWIELLLRALELERWEDLKGQVVRVRRDHRDMIVAVGHLIEEKWFEPETLKHLHVGDDSAQVGADSEDSAQTSKTGRT